MCHVYWCLPGSSSSWRQKLLSSARLLLFQGLLDFHFLFGHRCHLCQKKFFKGLRHYDNVFSSLVVNITVCKHCIEVLKSKAKRLLNVCLSTKNEPLRKSTSLYALLWRVVVIVFEPLFDSSKVHRMFNDFVIIWDVQFHCIHRLMKRPSELVFPNSFDNYCL